MANDSLENSAQNNDETPEQTPVRAKRAQKSKPKKMGRPKKKGRPKSPKRAKPTEKKPKKAAVSLEKKSRQAHQTRPTKEEEIAIMERRWLVWDLRKSGVNIRQISEHLKAKNVEGASIGQVHADLQFILNMQHEDLGLSVKQHIENEVAILDDMQVPFYTIVKRNGSNAALIDETEKAAGVVITTVKERSKLRNLYKPAKVELNVDEELARLLGIGVEELPDDVD